MTNRGSTGRFVQFMLVVSRVGLAGCSSSPIITVTNRSDAVLTDVVVSGLGFSEHIQGLPAGTSKTLTVRPRGESWLRVSFDSRGRHVDVDDLAYIEASDGYRVAVNVQPDLKVRRKRLWHHTISP
jgi:hypothetical protein